ncbi:hypothetical protein [Streptomyces sp. TP-A0874]|uniref:hypothetical protein n=1 Tax=Streptomyces sp. TP-A0874 TaxID=549819 RepID=UPI000853ED99|nr:hypothetical protein [Streptomyces sp. TP-A0874]
MRRRSYAPGAALAAVLLLGGAAGCTGAPGGGSGDLKPGGSSAGSSGAPPGKYRTLPEPCGAATEETLGVLLPGYQDLAETQRERAYAGHATLTYDTDRRVGCRWQDESSDGSRHLEIDFERVVSYDPEVSDDDRAQELYEKKAEAAKIPDASQDQEETGSGRPSSSPSDDPDAGVGKAGKSAVAGGKGKSGSPSESPPADASDDPRTAPRTLDDLGQVAYIDDRLVTSDSGVHRDVTVVFRASNVLVTVRYDLWANQQSGLLDSADLQEKAQRIAAELSSRFSD